MALLFDEEENSSCMVSKRRSLWVRNILKKTDVEYKTLCEMQKDHEEIFLNIFEWQDSRLMFFFKKLKTI